MSLLSILGLTAALFVLALTPGPGVFAVLGRALNSGFYKSLFLIAGIVSGDLIYLSFALSGLTWLAQNVNWVFTVVRILGGLYLILLGVKTFRTSPRGSDADREKKSEQTSSAVCYFEGLIITLSNPKVILFYCSFLPAFMDLKSISGSAILIAALIVSGVLTLVMTGYAFLAVQTGKTAQSEIGVKRLNRSGGILMMTAGAFLALKR